MALLTFPKGANVAIISNGVSHFISNEFDCGCRDPQCETKIDQDLVDKLEALRSKIGQPLNINSGYRCELYQNELRARGYQTAVGPSTHTDGRAADVATENPRLTGPELEQAARAVGFLAIGVAPRWIHVDLRSDKLRRWTYDR